MWQHLFCPPSPPLFPALIFLAHPTVFSSPPKQTNFYDGITNFNVCWFVIKFSAAVLVAEGMLILKAGSLCSLNMF